MAKRRRPPEYRLIFPMVVRHPVTKRLIRRRDGKRFRIWVKVKRNE